MTQGKPGTISFWSRDFVKLYRNLNYADQQVRRANMNPIIKKDIIILLEESFKILDKGVKHGVGIDADTARPEKTCRSDTAGTGDGGQVIRGREGGGGK